MRVQVCRSFGIIFRDVAQPRARSSSHCAFLPVRKIPKLYISTIFPSCILVHRTTIKSWQLVQKLESRGGYSSHQTDGAVHAVFCFRALLVSDVYTFVSARAQSFWSGFYIQTADTERLRHLGQQTAVHDQ